MSEQPDTFAAVEKRWRGYANDNDITLGDSEVEQAYNCCADELSGLEQRVKELRDYCGREAFALRLAVRGGVYKEWQ